MGILFCWGFTPNPDLRNFFEKKFLKNLQKALLTTHRQKHSIFLFYMPVDKAVQKLLCDNIFSALEDYDIRRRS